MEITKGAIMAIKALGIKVPDDVAVKLEETIASAPDIIKQLVTALDATEKTVARVEKKLDALDMWIKAREL